MNEPAKPFDYIEEAHVTASDKYYGDRVPLAYFRETIAEAVEALNKLDAIKKAMFYGRDTGVPAPEANAATLAKLPLGFPTIPNTTPQPSTSFMRLSAKRPKRANCWKP
ncbi:hypothetical protein PSAKC1_00055 [Pseudomonas phage PSA-KC1]